MNKRDASVTGERVDTVIALLARARWPDPAVKPRLRTADDRDGGEHALVANEHALVVDTGDRARVCLHFELGKLV